MKKTIFILGFLCIATACKKETGADNNEVSTVSKKKTDTAEAATPEKIKIESFAFPEEIKECSCYFSKNRTDFENEKYIYADDAAKIAYMKIDGKKVVLDLISSNDMHESDELSKEIETESYKISVKGKKIKGEEALLFEGTLTIEKPDGTTVTTPIYGECGC